MNKMKNFEIGEKVHMTDSWGDEIECTILKVGKYLTLNHGSRTYVRVLKSKVRKIKPIYHKELLVSCDDEMFASGNIKISWSTDDQDKITPLRLCSLSLNLQYGDVAILKKEDVDNLIKKLQIVSDRLS